MGPLFKLFNISVGAVDGSSTAQRRRAAYDSDVTLGSGQRIGFDVLRDQLVVRADDLIAPTPDVAIIDEADSVLVDGRWSRSSWPDRRPGRSPTPRSPMSCRG